MRRGVIYKIMIAFVALAVISFIPMRLKADSTLIITSDPSNYSGQIGETALFNVVAEGDGIKYQWQTLTNGDWVNSTLGGNKTATLSVVIKASRNGNQFRCVVSDSNGNSTTSGVATLYVATPFSIVTQPSDFSGLVGDTATFSVITEGDGIKYQWQTITNGDWVNCTLGGNKTSTLSVVIKDSRNGSKYRCIVTNVNGETITSDEATLYVSKPFSILTQPSDFSGLVGDTATFSVITEGDGIKYQWQTITNGDWVNCTLGGNKTSTLSVVIKDSRNGSKYRCIVTNGNGETITSDEATLYVNKDLINVTFDAGEGVFPSTETATITDSYKPGCILLGDFEVPVREGYKFLGWKNANGVYVNYVELSESTVFTAGWLQTYTVTYHANGGSFDDSDVYIEGDVNKGNYYIQYGIEPHRAGYIFVGWIYNNKPVSSSNRIRITGNADIYAEWAEAVTVTYNGNGGQWQHGDEDPVTTEIISDLKGTTYYFGDGIAEPYREGFKFVGWKIGNDWVESIVLTTDITVEAQWEGCVNVTFDANEGAWNHWEPDEFDGHWEQETQRVEQWETMESWINMDWPERDHYEFLGWSTDPEATVAEPQFLYDLTEDVVFYAIWRPMGVIHYNANGGEFRFYDGPNTYRVEDSYDDYVTGPDFYYVEHFMRPERDGYEFDCWVDSENKPITGDIIVDHNTDLTVYAKWLKRVTITYDANGGGWDVHVEQNGQEWDEFREKEYDYRMEGEYYRFNDWRPELEGYEWVGWMFEDETPVEDQEYLLDDDITVFAIWTKLKKVTYDANGGYYTYVNYDTEDYEYSFVRHIRTDEEFHLDGRRPEIDVDNRYFIGWTTEQDDIATLVDDSLDLSNIDEITLYAYWYTPATITYYGNGGIWREWDEENQEDIEVDTIVRTAWDDGRYRIEGWRPDYADRGEYEFVGYAIDEDSNEVAYYCDEELEFVADDLELYAVWKACPKLVFDAGEGVFWDGRTVETRYYGDNQKVFVRCEAPERLGYDFIGWAYADDPDQEIVDDTVLELHYDEEYYFVAVWEKCSGVIVTYDPNGGSFGEPEGKDFRGWVQDPDEAFAVGCAWPWRFGYEFVGWSLDPDATEAEKDWIYDLEEDTVFYAIWKRNVIVTLDATGGSYEVWVDGYWDQETDEWVEGYNDYVDYDYFSVKENSIIPVRRIDCYANREGYEFDGWTDAEGNYVNLVEVGTEDITLYASWVKTCKVAFDFNGGMDSNGNTEPVIWNYNEGDVIETVYLEEPYREGFMFVGWTVDNEYVTYVDVDRDLTFVAQWVAVEDFYN